jgi:hypothetical protein
VVVVEEESRRERAELAREIAEAGSGQASWLPFLAVAACLGVGAIAFALSFLF